MIKTLATLLLLAAIPPLCAQDPNPVHPWTSSDGRVIQAKFVKLDGESVIVEKDGKPLTIPFTKLASASVELAKRLQSNPTDEGSTTTQVEKENDRSMIAATDPTIQFRWLQTDPKTADAIVETLKANNLSADAFSAKINPQIKGGKITEVAAFDRKIVSGQRFILGSVNSKPPLVMEAEATVGNGYMDLRCVPEWAPTTPMGSGLLRCNTATTLSGNHWYLFARWGDAKTDTLLLACGGSKPVQLESDTSKESQLSRASRPPIMVHLDAEWRECSAADLAKVEQAPPESRAKALTWLRGRSTLLASATGTCKSGQRSRHEHLWGGQSDAESKEELNKRADDNSKEPPPRPGVTFEWETTIMESDKPFPTLSPSASIEENVAKVNEYIRSQELSLRLSATYMPPKSRSKSQGMEFVFRGNKLQPGVPEFVATTAALPEGQPVVVLVFTPWYDIIR